MPEILGESVLTAVPDEPLEVLLDPDPATPPDSGGAEWFHGGVAADSLLTR
jgi:hypothetical protein